MHVHVLYMTHVEVRAQLLGVCFFPSIIQVLGIKFRPEDLAAAPLPAKPSFQPP